MGRTEQENTTERTSLKTRLRKADRGGAARAREAGAGAGQAASNGHIPLEERLQGANRSPMAGYVGEMMRMVATMPLGEYFAAVDVSAGSQRSFDTMRRHLRDATRQVIELRPGENETTRPITAPLTERTTVGNAAWRLWTLLALLWKRDVDCLWDPCDGRDLTHGVMPALDWLAMPLVRAYDGFPGQPGQDVPERMDLAWRLRSASRRSRGGMRPAESKGAMDAVSRLSRVSLSDFFDGYMSLGVHKLIEDESVEDVREGMFARVDRLDLDGDAALGKVLKAQSDAMFVAMRGCAVDPKAATVLANGEDGANETDARVTMFMMPMAELRGAGV